MSSPSVHRNHPRRSRGARGTAARRRPRVDWTSCARSACTTRAPARVRDLEPREPGRVGIYACGPTVYNRIHVGNARPFVVFSLLARFLEHEGYDVDVRGERHRRQRQDLRRRAPARRPERRPRARDDGALRRSDTDRLGLGRPDAEPLASETIDGIVGPHPGAARRRATPTRSTATSTSACARTREYGDAQPPPDRRHGPGRGGRGRRPQGGSARLRALEGPEAGRGHGLGRARGAAAGPAGTSSAPRWPRTCSASASRSTAAAATSIFPHHENEAAQTRTARGAELTRIWMHNGMLQLGGEKMAKSVGNIESLHDADRARGAATRSCCCSSPSHYRQPMQYSRGDADRGPDGRPAAARGRAGCSTPGPSPADMAPLRDALLRRAGRRLPHAGGAGRRLGLGPRVQPPRRRRERRPARDARRPRPRQPARRRRDGRRRPDGAPGSCSSAASRRAPPATWPRPTGLRDELAAQGWQVRDSAAGPELVRAER